MRNLKKIVASLCLLGAVLPATSAVFIVAHPDDHMLMMGPNLISDVKGGYPTVIVIMTAGDAGNGIGDNAAKYPANADLPNPYIVNGYSYNEYGNQYYRVRLQANMLALDSIIPGGTPTGGRSWSQTTERFSTAIPAVEKWTLGNVILYHLNIPDDPTGLATILSAGADPVQDITRTNRYTVESLKETVRQIIARNNRNTPNVIVNYQRQFEPTDPVEDHPHHMAVGLIVGDALDTPGYECIWEARFHGYVQAYSEYRTANMPHMIDPQRRMYELAHLILAQRGNVTPHGGHVQNAAWMQSTLTPYVTDKGKQIQRGAMDAFHTNFYGKSHYDGRRRKQLNCAF